MKDYVKPHRIPACSQTQDYYKFVEKKPEELDAVVEYDMDEEVRTTSSGWFGVSVICLSL